MEYSKKDLQNKFNLSSNTVYATLQACGLSTAKQKYTSEEIENYFVVARQMLEEGKTQKQVQEYFAFKNGQALREEYQESSQELEAQKSTSNQTLEAGDTINNIVATVVTEMVEQGVKDIAPYIPLVVIQTINTQLNSGEVMESFEQMREEIKKRKGSAAAFLLSKMQRKIQPEHQKLPSREQKQLPQSSENSSENA